MNTTLCRIICFQIIVEIHMNVKLKPRALGNELFWLRNHHNVVLTLLNFPQKGQF